MNRGDVYWVNLDPVLGSEIGKKRPAIVLQNEAANRSSPTVTVIPLSTKVGRVYPFQTLIPAGEADLPTESKALCEQIRTISRQRLVEYVGRISTERLVQIREAVDRHLWL
ncbi:MAG: type II toxin-antitoxin system PemK/MazF family toxin [bacterium]|nr:type II toxin-antitoxin system PemK/MazF family toxin [bacterium]